MWSTPNRLPGGVGKTWSAEDFATLIDDVGTKLFDRFPDDTWVYPGHGNDTTLGAERPTGESVAGKAGYARRRNDHPQVVGPAFSLHRVGFPLVYERVFE